MKTKVHDLTTTWTAIMPALCDVIEHGEREGKRLAREELMDLAKKVDRLNQNSAANLYKPLGDVWSTHPDYDREDWKNEVAIGDTNLGYWEWVQHQIEEAV